MHVLAHQSSSIFKELLPVLVEYFRAVLEIEVCDVLGGKQRSILLIWCCEHSSDETTSASSCDHIKIVC